MAPSTASVPLLQKKDAVHAGNLGQRRRQRTLVGMVVEIGDVDHLARLFPQRLEDSRMGMAERVYSQAGNKVQVLLAAGVPHPAAFPALQDERKAGVGLHQEFFFNLSNVFFHGDPPSRRILTRWPDRNAQLLSDSGQGVKKILAKILVTGQA